MRFPLGLSLCSHPIHARQWMLDMVVPPSPSWTMPRAVSSPNRMASLWPLRECGSPTLTFHKPQNRVLSEKSCEDKKMK